MQEDQRNLFLAIALSAVLIFGYEFTFGRHHVANPPPPAPTAPAAPAIANSPAAQAQRTEVLAEAPRIKIETPKLHGTVSLAGGRIDDLVLANYYETIEKQKLVTLLSPAGSADPYFVEFGFTADSGTAVPTAQTVWTQSAAQTLTPATPITMTWDNGAGLVFTRTISVDNDYLFTIKQTVANNGSAPVTLHPYGTIVRTNAPTDTSAGGGASPTLAGYYGNGLDEITYKKLVEKGEIDNQATGGWVGMNDKYWLVAAVPNKTQPAALTLHGKEGEYTAGYRAADVQVAPGATSEVVSSLVAGAKEQGILERYQDAGIPNLEKTIDFGWLYILAKPFFLGIHYIALEVGNFGIAILIFNVVLKIFLFPLQDRSFHQMARMRDVQPKIAALKEKFGDDREKMATAQMELFKKEKINPASGCLPILIQLPIFYALYRVLSTTIEMRQAPFFGWIHDLSAPDPTTVFNLFGLIPWTPPHFLMLGVWPLIYGLTMYLQQKMTPMAPSTDPTQARVMAMMPLIFMFLFAQFPAGLTIYYSWNAVLTIGQMSLIRRRSDKRKAAAAGSA
ncbi:MAG TPA: membrane protein insertase YidC [Alphaproteobacteria bacterium]|jgi:YidC/Oxa1 family membrane protein insertase|nr:membrane protein insertase YidC [Alphaproteobacteria bacterium]